MVVFAAVRGRLALKADMLNARSRAPNKPFSQHKRVSRYLTPSTPLERVLNEYIGLKSSVENAWPRCSYLKLILCSSAVG
jgi:hypothetical protein